MIFVRHKETVDNYLWHRKTLKCDVQYLLGKPYEIFLPRPLVLESRMIQESVQSVCLVPRHTLRLLRYVHALALTAYTAVACLDNIHKLVNNIDRHDSDRISDNRYFILARVHYCPSNRKIKILIVA